MRYSSTGSESSCGAEAGLENGSEPANGDNALGINTRIGMLLSEQEVYVNIYRDEVWYRKKHIFTCSAAISCQETVSLQAPDAQT